MGRDPFGDGRGDVMVGTVGEEGGERPGEARGAILRVEVCLQGADNGGVLPVDMLGEDIEAGGCLLDLTHALPGLLAGEAGELAKGTLVGGDVEEVVTEDAHQAIV